MTQAGDAIERAVARLREEPRARIVYVSGSAARPGAAAPRDLDPAVSTRRQLSLAELLAQAPERFSALARAIRARLASVG